MDELKILMADDEPEVLSIMAKKVAEAGYTVVTAKDGQEAWDKIKSESPDIILLDLRMPRMDGFEVLKNVRANPLPDKWQPVIIVSALGELDNMRKGFDLEADHYLVKPCDIESILKSIRLMKSLIPQRRKKEEMGHN